MKRAAPRPIMTRCNPSPSRGTISRCELPRSPPPAWLSADVAISCALPFASCYVYSPRAMGTVAEASRLLCTRVKSIDPLWLPHYAGVVCKTIFHDRRLAALFAHDAVLVPVPGSSASITSRWVALQLATALSVIGCGPRVWIGLRRGGGGGEASKAAGGKSSTAPEGARPTVQQHYESFAVTVPVIPANRIVLIDDVVSKGRTLLAAAAG